jgi:hypothetical protein
MSAAQLLGGAIPLKTASLAVFADPSGADGWAGATALTAGTVTVTAPYLPANSTILLCPINTAGVGITNLAIAASAVSNGGASNASFTITSSANTDARAVKWVAILN